MHTAKEKREKKTKTQPKQIDIVGVEVTASIADDQPLEIGVMFT